jgi:hypothetical protein
MPLKTNLSRQAADFFAADKIAATIKMPAVSSVNLSRPSALTEQPSLDKGLLPSHKTEFFNSFTDKRKICFLVDCSGSMQGTFGRVRKELAESINSLLPEHYFSLIFFGSGRLFEFEDGLLVRASDKVKMSALAFIESIKPAGQTNAMQALQEAVRVCGGNSSVIYLLTDGFELTLQDTDRFAQQICNLLKTFAPQANVNTIGLWPQDEDFTLLKALASRTGGECVIIRENKSLAETDLQYTAGLNF